MTAPTHTAAVAEIQRRVEGLAHARRDASTLAARVKELRLAFEAEHALVIDMAKAAQATADAAETALRAIVAEHYAATLDPKPAPGIEVKRRQTLQYDREKAFAWARETKMAIVPESLDIKAFEKIAKATTLDFVLTVSEPMVTIATDLDKALSVAALTQPEPAAPTTEHSTEA